VDESGFIWAQKCYPYSADEYPENAQYRIISPQGEYLGTTTRPVASGTVSRGHFLTIQTNQQSGKRELIVYRIHSALRGFKYP
jgi:hypothetical protein